MCSLTSQIPKQRNSSLFGSPCPRTRSQKLHPAFFLSSQPILTVIVHSLSSVQQAVLRKTPTKPLLHNAIIHSQPNIPLSRCHPLVIPASSSIEAPSSINHTQSHIVLLHDCRMRPVLQVSHTRQRSETVRIVHHLHVWHV